MQTWPEAKWNSWLDIKLYLAYIWRIYLAYILLISLTFFIDSRAYLSRVLLMPYCEAISIMVRFMIALNMHATAIAIAHFRTQIYIHMYAVYTVCDSGHMPRT